LFFVLSLFFVVRSLFLDFVIPREARNLLFTGASRQQIPRRCDPWSDDGFAMAEVATLKLRSTGRNGHPHMSIEFESRSLECLP
jgi:hypothetical protein